MQLVERYLLYRLIVAEVHHSICLVLCSFRCRYHTGPPLSDVKTKLFINILLWGYQRVADRQRLAP